MAERTEMIREVLKRYGIDASLPDSRSLTLLEKEHQKLLRKLNHVFGNAEKEMELEKELDALEAAMEELERSGGGNLSLDDVKLETKSLSQTQVEFNGDAQTEEEEAAIAEMVEIRRLEKTVMKDQGKNMDVSLGGVVRLIEYYGRRGSFIGKEKWLAYAIDWFHYPQHTCEMYDLQRTRTDGLADPEKCSYWMRRAAKAGHKDACFEMGKECMRQKSPSFDLKQAAVCFAKAADREHPEAYLYAFTAFYKLGDYVRAETCLKAADKIGVPGAAYRLGVVYDVEENSYGRRNPGEALVWYEKAFRQNPDGNVCHGLGVLYEESGRLKEAEAVLKRGIEEYHSQDCEEAWEEMKSRTGTIEDEEEPEEKPEEESEEELWETGPEEEPRKEEPRREHVGKSETEPGGMSGQEPEAAPGGMSGQEPEAVPGGMSGQKPEAAPGGTARQELIRQAAALYEQGRYSQAALVYLKLKGEYELEGEYRAALCYLADEKSRFSRGLAKVWLKQLAKEHYKDSEAIYEREFGGLKKKKQKS